MIDGIDLADRLWSTFSRFLQTQWLSLAEAFVQARQCAKFREHLGLNALLPIQCRLSTTATTAVSGVANRSTDVLIQTSSNNWISLS